jgi:crotonobetainyl-CoA:carnitine CoA-transferase CaiB-like acyl-CoA transferase
MSIPDDGAGFPLSGIRVVALEQAVAVPLCSRHLHDLGADVVKVERPDGGDFSRHYDDAVNGLSANFVWLNHGKRSIALDLRGDEGKSGLSRLLVSADVFVHNLGPGAVDRLGFGWEVLHARNPRLVWCAISGYGGDGPFRDRKGFDLLLQGETGLLAVTGTPEAPAKVGIAIGDTAAGIYAVSAILAVCSTSASGPGSAGASTSRCSTSSPNGCPIPCCSPRTADRSSRRARTTPASCRTARSAAATDDW